MSDSVQAVDQVAREVEQTLKRYRERERELHQELVRITARFDERVRASIEELAQLVSAVDAMALERGSEAQIRRKALVERVEEAQAEMASLVKTMHELPLVKREPLRPKRLSTESGTRGRGLLVVTNGNNEHSDSRGSETPPRAPILSRANKD